MTSCRSPRCGKPSAGQPLCVACRSMLPSDVRHRLLHPTPTERDKAIGEALAILGPSSIPPAARAFRNAREILKPVIAGGTRR